ncbi:CAP domain-containing protein [Sphingomonas sp. HF-S4]|uniref:CAP domain-containing protein n=1 Tax=Sphingomonas agrestis TaxID=3080540 RepID=A0ABU3Y7U6_9SPHN|nr:CAP domain-containing protein [Sphingomonas sp. HF-S4]MDV3457449.1 CAP domain-containing protein [Sphingomonas sp. HF-S4]
MRTQLTLLMIPLLALAACGGSGSDGGGTVVPPPIDSGPTPSPITTPVPFPTPAPVPGDFFTAAASLYTTPPDITACQPGLLKPAVTSQVLQILNAVRALHRLPAVAYSAADEPAAQQSALMQAANAQLSHTPPASWRCFTQAGADASASSNLYGGTGAGLGFYTDEQIIAGWLTEVQNIVAENVGHRRWLLDPFLGSVAYGRVAGRYQTSSRADAAAIKVFDTAGPAGPAGPLPDFVAYPFEDYPARLFDASALLSFGVISNKTNKWGNTNVDFSNAAITVRARGGATLTVSRVTCDNQGYGLPNNVQFAVSGLQANTIYDVTIERVNVGGTQRSYSYFFRIVP